MRLSRTSWDCLRVRIYDFSGNRLARISACSFSFRDNIRVREKILRARFNGSSPAVLIRSIFRVELRMTSWRCMMQPINSIHWSSTWSYARTSLCISKFQSINTTNRYILALSNVTYVCRQDKYVNCVSPQPARRPRLSTSDPETRICRCDAGVSFQRIVRTLTR